MGSCWYYGSIRYLTEDDAEGAVDKVLKILERHEEEDWPEIRDDNPLIQCGDLIQFQDEVSHLADWGGLIVTIIQETLAVCGAWTSEEILDPFHYLELVNKIGEEDNGELLHSNSLPASKGLAKDEPEEDPGCDQLTLF